MDAPTIENLVKILFGLVLTAPGASALGVVIVNLLKIPGWVKDDKAQFAINVVNVLFALFFGAASLFTSWNIPGLDLKFADFAKVLTVFLPVFALIFKWLAPYLYRVVRGVPVVGYSHSLVVKK